MLSSFSNAIAERSGSIRAMFSSNSVGRGRAFSGESLAERAKSSMPEDVKYPIKAQCEVGPNGNPCHGKPEADSVCSGMVYFEQVTAETTNISWDLEGCGREGKHGFHIHTFSDFSDGCNSAGPHYNPFNTNHGAPWMDDRHVGDMGNVEVDKNGNSKGSLKDHLIKLDGWTSIVGRSVMVHEDEDDLGLGDNTKAIITEKGCWGTEGPPKNGFVSKVTGNAGARIACGEIIAA